MDKYSSQRKVQKNLSFRTFTNQHKILNETKETKVIKKYQHNKQIKQFKLQSSSPVQMIQQQCQPQKQILPIKISQFFTFTEVQSKQIRNALKKGDYYLQQLCGNISFSKGKLTNEIKINKSSNIQFGQNSASKSSQSQLNQLNMTLRKQAMKINLTIDESI